MIDTNEWDGAWSALEAAMPDLELPAATEALYRSELQGLPAGTFAAAVRRLVTGPGFDNRRLPTIHELRQLAHAAARPKGTPYVGGVPLGKVLDALEPRADWPAPDRDEAAALVHQVAARTPRALPSGPHPGNTGHRGLLRLLPPPREPMPEAEWEDRRRALLEQADELLGAGEPLAEEEPA